MPPEKAAIAAELMEMINRRDVEALAELVHPEYELHSVLASAGGGPYLGAIGIRRWFDDLDAAWDGVHFELKEVREAGERAVVVVHYTATGKASGVPVDGRLGQVLTWRDGRLWRTVVYTEPAEACRAAGLRQ
jgi:ketosteroid isomerase-like protein